MLMAWLASSKARKCRSMAVGWPGLGWEEVVDEDWAFQRGSVPREWRQGGTAQVGNCTSSSSFGCDL